MKRFFDGVTLLLVMGILGLAVWAWPFLPDQIPTHFGIDGQADAWSDRSWASWFSLPGVALLTVVFFGFFRALIPRRPGWVNLPDRTKLSELPEVARAPVFEMFSGFLALVQTELLLIFGLIQFATYRTAMGGESQGIMITVLILAILMSPILMVVFFLRLQPALERGKELARRAEAGTAGETQATRAM